MFGEILAAVKGEKSPTGTTSKKLQELHGSPETSANSAALKEALNKIKLLEGDYKTLHDKRLQDVSSFSLIISPLINLVNIIRFFCS